MIEIDWIKDYNKDFICYECQQEYLKLGGFRGKKKLFYCSLCKNTKSSSIDLKRRSLHLKTNTPEDGVDWNREYKGEFVCPTCNTLGMKFKQRYINDKEEKRTRFICSNASCRKTCVTFYSITIEPVQDPINSSIIWYTNSKIKDFVCPKCKSKNIYFSHIERDRVVFKCRNKECKSLYLNRYTSLAIRGLQE